MGRYNNRPGWYCPACDGRFDSGEKCDCETKKELMENESICLLIIKKYISVVPTLLLTWPLAILLILF